MYPIEKYNFVTYNKKNEDGTVSKITLAMSTYRGKVVKGVAKCTPTDEFDPEVGIKLAAARCDLKVCLKRNDRAIKKLHDISLEIEKLTEEYNRIHKYVDDSTTECCEAVNRLAKIEESLA